MRKIMRWVTIMAAAALLGSSAASADGTHFRDPIRQAPLPNEVALPPAVDFVLTRPFGFACIAGGAALFVALSPFSAVGDLGRPGIPYLKASSHLVVDPFRYTFVDRLGSH